MGVPTDPLRLALVAEIDRGAPSLDALGTLGDPDPAKSADALVRASRHADLAPTRREWLPGLLATARPGFGAQSLVEIAERIRSRSGIRVAPRALRPLALVLGSSDFLTRLLLRNPEWTDELRGDPPGPPAERRPKPAWGAIRAAKYRGLLRVAARDLMGRPFEQSLVELSDLADACLTAALECAARESAVEPPDLLALGKLGGRELNFSSDVDLLFVYLEENDPERNPRAVELVRALKSNLEARTEDGFGYRVDLDLRPEGRAGALANSVEAALNYYESFGAEWERQMLIRLRPVAGPGKAARAFQREITPFVYRTLIDTRAIAAVREMKVRIEAERSGSGVDLEADLKEGPGGIRDVEFLVQALQLFHGGREPRLRTGNALEALAALRDVRVLEEAAAESLRLAYLWLRRAEHALQMVEERQTHRFPRDTSGQVGLARRMGYRDGEAASARDRLLDDRTNVRAEVRLHFDALILREGGPAAGAAT